MALLAVFVAVVATGALVRATRSSDGDSYRGSEPPPGLTLPQFALHDERGNVVDSRSLRGKAVLVTFLDSQCRQACPVIAAAVGRAVARLSPDERRTVSTLAITTDPAGDTPARVRAFLVRERALGTLRYLTGGERQLRPVWREFAVLPSIDTGRHEIHSAPVRIYDRRGTWVATQYAGVDLSPVNLAHDLRLAASS